MKRCPICDWPITGNPWYHLGDWLCVICVGWAYNVLHRGKRA